jgi:hypothetical protein
MARPLGSPGDKARPRARPRGRGPGALCLAAGLALSAAGCGSAEGPPPPPLVLEVDRPVLEADGRDRATVLARLAGDAEGVVVSFSATGGFLSSSAVIPTPAPAGGAEARVVLVADREEALLGRPDKPVTVRATVTRSAQDVESATVELSFVTPTSGAPALTIAADPPAAIADGRSEIVLRFGGRRVAAGTTASVTTSAGALSVSEVAFEDDGQGGVRAEAVLRAPDEPAEALVTVREPGGAFATLLVRFVADGEAQFDLTGTFAQFSPARIRMRAATLTPNPQCVVAPAFVKVDIVQEGEQIDATFTTCFVTLAPVRSIVGEVTNEAPPAFLGAIPQVRAAFALPDVALGATFDPPPSVVVSGAALESPTEALPTSPNDARVRDSDGDGRPGVTVINSLAGEQNVTFRNTGDTRGVVRSSNHVEGATVGDLTALPESSVLSASNGFLPKFESVPSVWEMVRVDGRHGSPNMDTNGDGDISCAEIVDARAFLFSLAVPSTPIDCAGVP